MSQPYDPKNEPAPGPIPRPDGNGVPPVGGGLKPPGGDDSVDPGVEPSDFGQESPHSGGLTGEV